MTCPCCGSQFPWEAGLLEDDAKRLAAILADMEPPLARAAMSYLRLFKPAKTALRLPRAIKLLHELAQLVNEGSVCRDARTGARRPAAPVVWVAGIEQMLQQAGRLTLPLASHGYLREVVYGLADKADAAAERERDAALRSGHRNAAKSAARSESRLDNELAFLAQMLSYDQIDKAEHDRRAKEARKKYGAKP